MLDNDWVSYAQEPSWWDEHGVVMLFIGIMALFLLSLAAQIAWARKPAHRQVVLPVLWLIGAMAVTVDFLQELSGGVTANFLSYASIVYLQYFFTAILPAGVLALTGALARLLARHKPEDAVWTVGEEDWDDLPTPAQAAAESEPEADGLPEDFVQAGDLPPDDLPAILLPPEDDTPLT